MAWPYSTDDTPTNDEFNELFGAIQGRTTDNLLNELFMVTISASGLMTLENNLKVDGVAAIGRAISTNVKLDIGGTLVVTGNITTGIFNRGSVDDTTTTVIYNRTSPALGASAVVTNLFGYYIVQGTYTGGSAIANQYGFYVESNFIGASGNNIGFRSSLPLGSGNWNFYAAGNADNFFAGNLGIGITPTKQIELSADSAGKPATNTWTIISDIKIKENIELADIDICYNDVKNLPLKRATWRDDIYTTKQVRDRTKIGWMADDVIKVFPKSVGKSDFIYQMEKKDDDGKIIQEEKKIKDCLDLNSDQIYASMFGAIQKLIQKVEALEK